MNGSRVFLTVSDDPMKTVLENAFIEACHARQTQVVLDPERANSEMNVSLLVLQAGVQYREVAKTAYQRTVRTTIEARFHLKGFDDVRLLGPFHCELTDTVQERESAILMKEGTTDLRPEEGGFFLRMLTPMVVLAGSMIVVFLFFAVRS